MIIHRQSLHDMPFATMVTDAKTCVEMYVDMIANAYEV